MAFHKDHVVRFLAAAGLKAEEGTAILQRADAAIETYSDKNTGMFSGGKLDEIIGTPELAAKFNDMWEKGQLHP